MKKYIFTLLLVVVPSFAFGQEPPTNEIVTVATVNLYRGEILSQQGIQYTVAFDIHNREGAQGEIRYAVGLQNAQGAIVDRIYSEESLGLIANESERVEVVYELPAGLTPETEYILFAEATNNQGLILGFLPITTLSPQIVGSRPAQVMDLASGADPEKVRVMNILLDKDTYQKGDTAQVSFFWMNPGAEQVVVGLRDGKGKQCAESSVQPLNKEQIVNKVALSVKRECGDPEVTVTLKDASGEVMAESSFQIETTPESFPGLFWQQASPYKIYLLIGLIPVLVLIIFVWLAKRRAKSIPHFVLFGALIMGGLAFSQNVAKADTMSLAIDTSTPVTGTGSCNITVQVGTGGYDPIDSTQGHTFSYYNLQKTGHNCNYVSAEVSYSPSSVPSGTPAGSYTGTASLTATFSGAGVPSRSANAQNSFPYNVGVQGRCDYSGAICNWDSEECPYTVIANSLTPACSSGTLTNVSGTQWTCTGSGGAFPSNNCSYRLPDAACGSAVSDPFSTSFCSQGTYREMSQQAGTPYRWACDGTYYHPICQREGSGGSGGGGGGSGGGGGGEGEYPPGTFCGSRHGLNLLSTDTSWPSGSRFCPYPISLMYPPGFPSPGQTVTWTCSGGSGSYSSCSASRNSVGSDPPPPPSLKVCQNSCSSGVLRGKPGTTQSFTVSRGGSQNLAACYNIATDCSDGSGEVTSSTTWAEGGSSVVSLTGANPKVVNGISAGTETISASYSGSTANMSVTVTCVPTISCANAPGRENHCEDETFTVDNGCGNTITCDGTNACNYNWTEVSP